MKNNIRLHAPSSVFAFWSLSDWKSFKTYTTILDPVKNPYEQSFFSAVLLIKQKLYAEASKKINIARQHLDTQVSSLLQESYIRAYGKI